MLNSKFNYFNHFYLFCLNRERHHSSSRLPSQSSGSGWMDGRQGGSGVLVGVSDLGQTSPTWGANDEYVFFFIKHLTKTLIAVNQGFLTTESHVTFESENQRWCRTQGVFKLSQMCHSLLSIQPFYIDKSKDGQGSEHIP